MEKKEKNFAERVEEIDALLVTLNEDFPESTTMLTVVRDIGEGNIIQVLGVHGDLRGLSLCMRAILKSKEIDTLFNTLITEEIVELGN